VYFRYLLKNNKADKDASLIHATCLNQDRWQQFKVKIKNLKNGTNYYNNSDIDLFDKHFSMLEDFE